MSRIDTATLNLSLTTDALVGPGNTGSGAAKIKVFATNYNVLRIMSGMGGLNSVLAVYTTVAQVLLDSIAHFTQLLTLFRTFMCTQREANGVCVY
jgi:hypothetical protein